MISFNVHGTRAVQKLIEIVREFPDLAGDLVLGLKISAVHLINDSNGNHVIQKCLHLLGSPYNQFIYDTEEVHMIEIATHRHGCYVLQRPLDSAASI